MVQEGKRNIFIFLDKNVKAAGDSLYDKTECPGWNIYWIYLCLKEIVIFENSIL